MNMRAPSALFLVFALAISGCAKTLDDVGFQIQVSNKSHKAVSSTVIANDIKGILVAGGLDVVAPSSPTSETVVAEMANGSSTDIKEAELLIAKLESEPEFIAPSPETAVAEINKDEDVTTELAMALAPRKSPSAALQTAPRPSKRSVQVFEAEVSSVSFTYPEIGVAALELEPIEPPKPTTVATLNQGKTNRIQTAQSTPRVPSSSAKPKRF